MLEAESIHVLITAYISISDPPERSQMHDQGHPRFSKLPVKGIIQ